MIMRFKFWAVAVLVLMAGRVVFCLGAGVRHGSGSVTEWSELETNVVVTHPATYPNARPMACPDGLVGCLVMHWDNGKPQYNTLEKTVTTTVVRQDVLMVSWLGDRHWVTNRTVVTNWVEDWSAQVVSTTNWVKGQARSDPFGGWTNSISNSLACLAMTNWAVNVWPAVVITNRLTVTNWAGRW